MTQVEVGLSQYSRTYVLVAVNTQFRTNIISSGDSRWKYSGRDRSPLRHLRQREDDAMSWMHEPICLIHTFTHKHNMLSVPWINREQTKSKIDDEHKKKKTLRVWMSVCVRASGFRHDDIQTNKQTKYEPFVRWVELRWVESEWNPSGDHTSIQRVNECVSRKVNWTWITCFAWLR